MRNGYSSLPTSSITVDNTQFAGEDIVEGWACYFGSLSTPVSDGFCPVNSRQVEEDLPSFFSKGPSNITPLTISADLVRAAVQSISLTLCTHAVLIIVRVGVFLYSILMWTIT